MLAGSALLAGMQVNGQTVASNTLGTVSISSPTAGSLGKFGDIPVSYHTGIPQISIPLYTVEAGPLKLPIGLSYHASGIKVQEPAGWVGINWALEAGGVITRTVQGQPDEGSGSNEIDGHFRDYGYDNYLYSGGQEDWTAFAEGRKDGEPDLFFYNFAGHSGKFYFRDDRTPVIVPEEDMQIVPGFDGSHTISYFTITLPNGDQYVFGDSPGVTGTPPIETTNPVNYSNGPMGYPPVSSWYLNKIISADGQFSITLSYQPESYGYFTVAMFPVAPTTPVGKECDLVKNIITGVRLSQISFPNGTVNFTPGAVRTDLSNAVASISDNVNTSARTLGSISIQDNTGYCKKDSFYYGYFSGDTSPLPTSLTAGVPISTDELRLRLDSIQETTCDGSTANPPYTFSYASGKVPRRLSYGIDHWGYYNGVDNNSTLIPTLIVDNQTRNGANRDAAFPAMEAGVLSRISYPTGGYTAFDYESNEIMAGTTTIYDYPLASIVLLEYGQNTQRSQTFSVTFSTDPITVRYTSTCNYAAQLTIVNSSSQTVYNVPLAQGTPANPVTDSFHLSFPAGNYTITVALPSNVDLSYFVGGYTGFITQPTAITNYSNVVVGGLRVKTITDNDGISSNNRIRSFTYTLTGTTGGSSSMVLYSKPVYAQAIRNDLIATVGYWSTSGFASTDVDVNGCPITHFYYLSPSSIRPMESVQGYHIGYSVVKVSEAGNGYSMYHYYTSNGQSIATTDDIAVRNISTTCTSSAPNYPPAPLPFETKRGELYYEQHFNESGDLLKTVFYYPEYNEAPVVSTPGFIVSNLLSASGKLLGTKYTLNTVKKTAMEIEETDRDPVSGTNITSTKRIYYGSPFHNQPTRTVTATSGGDSLITNTRYATDIRLASCDAISDCSAEYNTDCATCQADYDTARRNCSGNSACLTNAYLTYLQCLTNARIGYTSCRKTNYTNTNSSFNTCKTSAEGSADAELKPILALQDEHRIVPIEETQWKNNNLLHASFTRYDYVTDPSGIPFPNKTQLINLQAPSSTFTSAAVSGNTLAKDNRYADEASYNHAAGNPVQVTLHGGLTSSYIWDYANTRPIAKASNATVDQIAFTSFESDGKGGWTFSGTPLADASAPAGNNGYNVSQPVGKSGLNTAKTYIVSYWKKSGATVSVSGSQSSTQGKTINGWTYMEHKVSGVSTVSVSGSGYIDELRLYPADAQMTSYTYSPLVGMTTSDDAAGRITYYQYDGLGRLSTVKDQDGNVIKTIQYHYKGQTTQTLP
jgi:YD repeat-containing protein